MIKKLGLFLALLLALSALQVLAQEAPAPGELYNRNLYLDAYFAARHLNGPEVPSLPAPEPESAAPSSVPNGTPSKLIVDGLEGSSSSFEAARVVLQARVGGGALVSGSRSSNGAILGAHMEARQSLRRVIRDLN